ncbi:MAG TPA: alpha/beta fold hydrolase [Rhizomicrobium sp.]|nr:alpha/beta fold hydrolase [Rhizomicrobium sp.]
MKLAYDRGGGGGRLLVLLHGLGATRNVWKPMLAQSCWDGRWIAPDLRGHGASPHASDYSLAAHAADIGELVDAHAPVNEIVVLGHSMGGAIALELASGAHGFTPKQVFGVGIKVAWNDDERAGMRKMASMAVKCFPAKEEAVARYLKVSGLHGLIAPESDDASAGVAQTGEGWRLAFDPATASVGAPPIAALLSAANAPIHLARGATDHMVSREQLAVYDADARDLPGGHNVMVENPAAVWDWMNL